MEKIAVKTKIKTLELGCRKQHIEFKAFDMTSRQVANVDKIIRNNENEYIRLTIGPEVERMDIEPIVSVVKLVAMECAGKGQHIKIAGFKTSGDKLDIINQYINSEADVLVTFEQTQEKLIDETPEDTTDSTPSTNSGQADSPQAGDPQEQAKDIELKLPKTWGTQCMITIDSEDGKYRAGYTLKIGHVVDSELLKDSPEYYEADSCMKNIKNHMFAFIDAQENFKHSKPLKKKIEAAVEKWMLENT